MPSFSVRNGILAITAFGVSCAGTVHFLSHTRYKEAFGAAALSVFSLKVAVDSLTNESNPDHAAETEDLDTLCDALTITTDCLSQGTELNESHKFNNIRIKQIWNNFTRALKQSKTKPPAQPQTVVNLITNSSQPPANLSPLSKALLLNKQHDSTRTVLN